MDFWRIHTNISIWTAEVTFRLHHNSGSQVSNMFSSLSKHLCDWPQGQGNFINSILIVLEIDSTIQNSKRDFRMKSTEGMTRKLGLPQGLLDQCMYHAIVMWSSYYLYDIETVKSIFYVVLFEFFSSRGTHKYQLLRLVSTIRSMKCTNLTWSSPMFRNQSVNLYLR